jgi:hypothetical protein
MRIQGALLSVFAVRRSFGRWLVLYAEYSRASFFAVRECGTLFACLAMAEGRR